MGIGIVAGNRINCRYFWIVTDAIEIISTINNGDLSTLTHWHIDNDVIVDNGAIVDSNYNCEKKCRQIIDILQKNLQSENANGDIVFVINHDELSLFLPLSVLSVMPSSPFAIVTYDSGVIVRVIVNVQNHISIIILILATMSIIYVALAMMAIIKYAIFTIRLRFNGDNFCFQWRQL